MRHVLIGMAIGCTWTVSVALAVLVAHRLERRVQHLHHGRHTAARRTVVGRRSRPLTKTDHAETSAN